MPIACLKYNLGLHVTVSRKIWFDYVTVTWIVLSLGFIAVWFHVLRPPVDLLKVLNLTFIVLSTFDILSNPRLSVRKSKRVNNIRLTEWPCLTSWFCGSQSRSVSKNHEWLSNQNRVDLEYFKFEIKTSLFAHGVPICLHSRDLIGSDDILPNQVISLRNTKYTHSGTINRFHWMKKSQFEYGRPLNQTASFDAGRPYKGPATSFFAPSM